MIALHPVTDALLDEVIAGSIRRSMGPFGAHEEITPSSGMEQALALEVRRLRAENDKVRDFLQSNGAKLYTNVTTFLPKAASAVELAALMDEMKIRW